MKKLIAIVIVGIMSLSLLTGCGGKKTEEQQAVEEIRQHMQDEAAEDGVMIEGISKSAVIISASESGGSHYYLYDITSSEAALVSESTEYDEIDALIPSEEKLGEDYGYAPADEITLEELNRTIIRNTAGAASEAYL